MRDFKILNMNEKGSVLLIALLVLMLAGLIAISSVNISTQETRIAGNERAATAVFFEADAGIAPGVQVLLATISNRSVGSYPALQWRPATLASDLSIFLDEVLGVTTADNRGFDFMTPANDPRGITTQVRIQRNMATTRSTGGSTEFGSGYEGIGYGSTGGVHIYYHIRSAGVGPEASRSRVETEYRKVK